MTKGDRSHATCSPKRIWYQAITHFSQDGKDRVDILTLPSDFPRYENELEPIGRAVLDAKNGGIIILAAAGNEGDNASVFWPASVQETGDVIWIDSSDGKGLALELQSQPRDRPLDLHSGSRCPIVTDTSYRWRTANYLLERGFVATTIAAAIVVIILGVVDHADVSKYEGLATLPIQ
ncbi:hypothetical protein V8C43DRAFT_310785 [Trichoderma afarasin]